MKRIILILLLFLSINCPAGKQPATIKVIGIPSSSRTIPYWWIYIKWHEEYIREDCIDE